MSDIVDGEKCTLIPHTFNGVEILEIAYQDRRVFLAQHIGAGLGYSDPSKLSTNVTEKWSEDLLPDRDCIKLTNGALATFKAAVNHLPDREVVDPRASHLILLTESGAQLAAILSRTAQGRAFRRWLVDVVPPERRKAQADPPAPPAPPKARGGRGSRLGGARPRPLLAKARGLADLKYNYLIDWQMNAVDRYDTEGEQNCNLEVRDHLMYRTLRLLNNCDVESWRSEVWKGVAKAVGMTLATFEGDPLLEEARAKGWLIDAQAKDLLIRMDDFQLVRALSLVAQQMGVAKVVSGFSLQLSGWRWSPGPDPADELKRLRTELERANGELERIQPLKRRSSG